MVTSVQRKSLLLLAGASVLGMVVASSVQAAVIAPTAVTATTFYGTDQSPDNLINGEGLDGVGAILSQKHWNQYNAEKMWHSSGGVVANENVTFDLGSNVDLAAAYIWQFAQDNNTGRGVKDFSILVSSTDSGNNFVPVSVVPFSLVQSTDQASGPVYMEPVQTISFSASNVRRVQFAIASDWNGSASDYVGLSEVRFESVVPEPISLAVLSLAGLGLMRRRRF